MKGIDFIDALSQIDPALADSYLNGVPSAEHPRRLKLLSAASVLDSMAACAALVFGFQKLAAPDPASTEQSSEVSAISLQADSTDAPAAAVTTAAVTEKATVTAAAEEKASAKTTAAPKQTQPQVTTKTQPKKLTAPNLVGKTIDQVNTDYLDTYPIFFAEYKYSNQPHETI